MSFCIFLSNDIKAEERSSTAVTNQKNFTSAESKNRLAEWTEQQGPLDLSIPHADVKERGPFGRQNTWVQTQKKNIFTGVQNKTRPMQVVGRLLTSQEPETEKQKSTEGVGIVINIKP